MPETSESGPERDRARLWRRWVLAFTLGELVGFGGIPVLGGAIALWATADLDAPTRSAILYGVAVVGGLGEGSVLGWFQVTALRGHLPRLSPGRWIRMTAAAAAIAWACGMLAPTLDDVVGLPASAQIAIWIPAGIVILLSIGGAQAWALRGVVAAPMRWLGANVLGWLAGLPWTFVLPALVPDGSSAGLWLATFVVAGVLMGATAGAITGSFLIRLNPLGSRTAGS